MPVLARVETIHELSLPAPGTMVHLSPSYTPAHLQGLTIHPDNALKFDFLIHKGDGNLTSDQKKQEYTKLVKYFLASLTVPDKDQWVNLSPYEKDRIIDNNFGKTEMGRDLLGQDYFLKQITSSLMYPESGLGKEFWDKVYAAAYAKYGNTNIPVNTFNKVWIIPDEASVYESGNTVYILKSHLKVMLEEDYLATQKNQSSSHLSAKGGSASGGKVMLEEDYLSLNKNSVGVGSKPTLKRAGYEPAPTENKIGSQIIREIILPTLEREVNEGKNFAQLRQIVSGMILATWYKKALKESLLGKIYADKAKVKGVNQPACRQAGIQCMDNEEIYQQYLKAFKKGVYNYIKEDEDKYTHQIIPRKYFAGGFEHSKAMITYDALHLPSPAMIETGEHDLAQNAIDRAMVNIATTNDVLDAEDWGTFNSRVRIVPGNSPRERIQMFVKNSMGVEEKLEFLDGDTGNTIFIYHHWAIRVQNQEYAFPIFPDRLEKLGTQNISPGVYYNGQADGRKFVIVDRIIGKSLDKIRATGRGLNEEESSLLVGLLEKMIINRWTMDDFKPSQFMIGHKANDPLRKIQAWLVDGDRLEEQPNWQEYFVADQYYKAFELNLKYIELKHKETWSVANTNSLSSYLAQRSKKQSPAQVSSVNDLEAQLAKGGIDLNSANLAMTIKRDGKGVPLPLVQQDLAQLSQIEGFEPHILEITPITSLPFISELRENLH